MIDTAALPAISRQIWDMKYRFRPKVVAEQSGDERIEDTWWRVANALSKPEEPYVQDRWAHAFYRAMEGFKFLPGGRILAGAGTGRSVTLFNCYVMGTIPDSLDGIFDAVKEAALTMQQGGGIGYDFSTIRPKGAAVRGVDSDASGPLSFMDVWDAMCRTIMSAGSRRGAMMATLRCDHPDILDFVEAKRDPARLRMFNLSVLVTDLFMDAVAVDADWPLVFDGQVYRTVRAAELWDRIMQATYDVAEPGVIFIDRINKRNNLAYCEEISATNPCGEVPLPPYGACLLGSINLAALVKEPFTAYAHLDDGALEELVPMAVRMLDNVIEVSRFPLAEQEKEARDKRRLGLGVTGLADALIMCGMRYGSPEAVATTERWMAVLRHYAYRASVDLAAEKGPFPLFDPDRFMAAPGILELDGELRQRMTVDGIRNSHLLAIAPTGTISLFAGNVSSGIEPVFAWGYDRQVLQPDGTKRTETVADFAERAWQDIMGTSIARSSETWVTAQDLTPADHVAMQAAVQKYVDQSISKTINCPEEIGFETFKGVYRQAFEAGCKGCTTYRPNAVSGSVLSLPGAAPGGDPEAAEDPEEGKDPERGRDQGPECVPMVRPVSLPGETYKLKWADSDHAIYITINDVVEDGRRRPFEVFINSKNMEHFAWTVALTRMISAVFRRGGDVGFVVEELKAVFDPRGGQWQDGRYVPSLLAAIGGILETHMAAIGFVETSAEAQVSAFRDELLGPGGRPPGQCPACGEAALIRQSGCDTCTACGHSKCG